jgi:hypothetical protein
MKSLYFWLFLLAVAVLPAAFFGANIGSVLGYGSEFHTARATHGQGPQGHLVLCSLEVLGALLFSLPGIIGVGWYYSKQKRESNNQVRVTREAQDETVWPPPPLE